MFKQSIVRIPIFILAGMISTATVFAQDRTGQVEIAGFIGGSYLRVEGEGDTKGAFGGRIGAVANGRILVFGEFSYYPVSDVASVRALRGCPPGVCPGSPFVFRETHVSGRLWDFAGGAQVNLTSGDSKAEPYALGTLGVGYASAEGRFAVRSGMISNQLHIDASDTALSLGVGAGLRYRVGSNWGFQPEIRYSRHFFEDAGLNNLRFTAGVFYRFGE